MITVHGDAAAHHIKLQFRNPQRSAAVGRMQQGMIARRMGKRHIFPKACALLERKAVIRQLRNRKVRKHAVKPEIWAVLKQGKRFPEVLRMRKADAVHAGIDLEMKAAEPPKTRGGGLQLQQRMRRKHGGNQIVLHNAFQVRIHGRAENQNGNRNARHAKARALLSNGHAQIIRPVALHKAGHLFDAVPIGVGLDHGQILRFRPQSGFDLGNIVRDAVQLNFRIGCTQHGASPPFNRLALRPFWSIQRGR